MCSPVPQLWSQTCPQGFSPRVPRRRSCPEVAIHFLQQGEHQGPVARWPLTTPWRRRELLWCIRISQLLILSNHLGGLSSSVTGEMGTFCWAATDCLRGNHLKVLTSEATMMIIIICRCAIIAAWLVSLPAVDREVAEVFKDEVGFTRSFSKEIHRRIRHWRFDEC